MFPYRVLKHVQLGQTSLFLHSKDCSEFPEVYGCLLAARREYLEQGKEVHGMDRHPSDQHRCCYRNTGIQESLRAGRVLREAGFSFDICFTSMLNRAITTFNYAAEELDIHYIPVVKSWKLN
jgi:hypothetical protein